MKHIKLLMAGLILILSSRNAHALVMTSVENSHVFSILSLLSAATMQPYRLNGVEVGSRCQNFVTSDWRLGPLGMYTVEELTSNPSEYSELLSSGGDDMNQLCPNFSNLDLRQKALVWTMILTIMAHYESTCNNSETNRGAPNGVARGLFQLHQGSEAAYDGSDTACVRNASYNAEQSIRCTLGMLNRQLTRDGIVFSSRSYWDVLRPNGEARTTDEITSVVSQARICN